MTCWRRLGRNARHLRNCQRKARPQLEMRRRRTLAPGPVEPVLALRTPRSRRSRPAWPAHRPPSSRTCWCTAARMLDAPILFLPMCDRGRLLRLPCLALLTELVCGMCACVQAVPKELRDEVEAENVEYDQLYAKWQHEQEMCRLRVFHGGENCLVVLHQGKTVREALESAHAQLVAASSGDGDGDGDGGGASPETVPLSRCRLRQFDYLKGIAGRPIEDLDASLLDAGVTTRSSLKLETRAEGEEFSSWAEGGLDLLLVHLPADADSFDFPVQVSSKTNAASLAAW